MVNTFVGLLITILVSPFIYWLCDIEMSFPKMNMVAALFTVVSIIRNYIIRRWFNKVK